MVNYNFWVVKLSSFTGITALNNSSQTLLYPNPASNYFTIESTSFERQLLQVYDITGKLVITKYLEPGKNNIDCDGFNNGIYNLHISSNEFPVNKRLMIIR